MLDGMRIMGRLDFSVKPAGRLFHAREQRVDIIHVGGGVLESYWYCPIFQNGARESIALQPVLVADRKGFRPVFRPHADEDSRFTVGRSIHWNLDFHVAPGSEELHALVWIHLRAGGEQRLAVRKIQ